MVAFDTFGDAVQALINKDVDGVVIDDTAGVGYVGVNADKIKLLPEKLVGQQLGFVFPKGSDAGEAVQCGDCGDEGRWHAGSAGQEVVRRHADSTYDEIAPGAYATPRQHLSRKIILFKNRGSACAEPRFHFLPIGNSPFRH